MGFGEKVILVIFCKNGIWWKSDFGVLKKEEIKKMSKNGNRENVKKWFLKNGDKIWTSKKWQKKDVKKISTHQKS